MKILYIITKSEPGGAQIHIAQLCEYFKRKGYEIAVMSSPNGWLQLETERLGVRFFSNRYFSNSLNPVNIVCAFLKTVRIFKEFSPDVVHCHSSAAGIYGRLGVFNRVPVLFTAHGWSFNLGVPSWQKLLGILSEKLASLFCCKIICVADFVRDLGIRYRVAPLDKFEVIHNGVEDFSNIPKIKHDGVCVVFSGRLAEPKLPENIIKAFLSLPDNIKKDINLKIIGSGPKIFELKEIISSNKGYNNISVEDDLDRSEAVKIVRNSDVFVLLSRWEGLPLTILEACSCGVPIIASNVGGVREVVDASNGVLLESNSIEDLKKALEDMILDEQKRIDLGKGARITYEKKFRIENMLEKTEKVYQGLFKK